ncbi:hypothetical protein CC80DRAFT_541772 [Byssothecium circinans]|uniref:Uncharacterized protein n=1 Tax=Byssothecium circinans TaxID=147558 RepID=A0A6A5UF82_9PLEO|nr:hypothetical protein CC80DRAFT_541772 [Byssothecium circinans]
MKLTISLVALALSATGALARTAAKNAALAEEADRRKYKNQSLQPAEGNETPGKRSNIGNVKAADIFSRKEQACYWDASKGCSDGYYWKACGSAGEWCWTA